MALLLSFLELCYAVHKMQNLPRSVKRITFGLSSQACNAHRAQGVRPRWPLLGTMASVGEAAKKAASSPRIRKAVLQLTENAAARIRELLGKRETEYLKLSVRSRGCNGLSYTMSYAGARPRGSFQLGEGPA